MDALITFILVVLALYFVSRVGAAVLRIATALEKLGKGETREVEMTHCRNAALTAVSLERIADKFAPWVPRE